MPYNTNASNLEVHNTFLTGGVDSNLSTSFSKPTGILGSGPFDSFKKKKMEKEGEEG